MMKNMGRAPSLMHRALVGFIALLMAVMSTISISAPSAHAQVPPGAGAESGAAAAELTKGMVDVMIKVCNAEDADGTALMECLQKAGLDAMQVADLTACLVGNAAGADDNENSTGPTDPEGKTSNEKLRECFDKFVGEEPEEKKVDDADDLSLGRMASALSSLYVNALVPGGTDAGKASDDEPMDATDAADAVADAFKKDEANVEVLEAWSKGLNHISSAGSFLGRPDSKEKLNTQWLMGPGDSKNNAVYSYAALDRQGFTSDNGSSFKDVQDQGTFGFAVFGAALSGMGFDQTISSDATFDSNRKILGSMMLLAYVAAGLVDTIFSSAISVLQYLNPFNLLLDGIKENTNAQFTSGIGGEEIPNSSLEGLKEFVATVYTGAVNLGWQVTIPIFFALTIIGLFMFNGRNKGRNIKQLLIRMFFAVIMIPLLGVTYTSALDSMKGATGDAATGSASKIVLSTYVDFQGWFENSRLDLPAGAGTLDYDVRSGAPTDKSQAGARNFALSINATNNDAWESLRPKGKAKADWGAQMTSEQEQINAADGTGKSTEQFTEVVNLLQRYINGDTLSAGGYESDVKASLTALGQKHPDEAKAIQDWVKKYTNVEALMTVKSGHGDGGADDMVNPLIFTSDSNADAFQATVAVKGDGPGVVRLSKTSDLNRENCPSSLVVGNGWSGDADDPSAHAMCALSPLAAYNYLNTSFDSLSATTYSPDQSTSQFTRLSHASVSAIGSGAMPYVYWFSAMTLLVSFSLIGILYAMFMVINTIRRGFQLIAAIPFGVMGFMAGIAKSIVYVIAMFLEIFLTFFVFKLVQEFLLVMPQLIETPLIGQLSGEGAEVGGILGGLGAAGLAASNPLTVVTVVTLISTFGVALFTIMALKLRSTLVSAMDEAATRAINRFTDSNVSGGNGNGQPGALRQGVARGAGMAAAHQMMTGGDSGDAGQTGEPGEPGTADDAPRTNFGGSDGPGDGMSTTVDGNVDGDVDGVDGQNGGYTPDDGSYSVDGDGVISDSDGAVVDGGNGEPMTLESMGAANEDGNLVTADGNEIIGADGKPISAEGVAGIDSSGALMDANGNVITDANGQALGVDPSGQGVGAASGYTSEGGDGMSVGAGEGTYAGGGDGVSAAGTGELQSGQGEGSQSIESLPGAQSQQYEMAGVSSDAQTRSFAGIAGGAGEASVAGGIAGGVAGAAARSMSGGNGSVGDAVSGAAHNVSQAAPAMMQNAQQVGHQVSGGRIGSGGAQATGGFGVTPTTGAPSGTSGVPGTPGASAAPSAPTSTPGAPGAPGAQSPSARQAGYTNVAHTTQMGGGNGFGNIARGVAGGVVGGAVTNAVAGNRRRGVAHEATGGQSGGGNQSGGGQMPMGGRRRGGANRMTDGERYAAGRAHQHNRDHQRGRGENFNMNAEVQNLQMHQRRVDQMRRDNGVDPRGDQRH